MNNLIARVGSPHLILIAILLFFFGLGLARVNDLSLYSDSTRYVIWGNSLAHGKGFVDDTQPTPEYYVVNAPLYAGVLAPVLLIFPLSVAAAKIWTLILGTIALFLFSRWLSRMVSPGFALAGTFLMAVNPLMLVISTEALSESTFLLVLFAAFLLVEQVEEEDKPLSRRIFFLVSLLALVMLLREAAVALVFGTTVYLFLRKKHTAAILVFGVALAFFALWTLRNTIWMEVPIDSQQPNVKFIFGHFVTTPDASLLEEMVQRVWINVKGYFANAGGLLFSLFPFNLIVAPGGLFVVLTKILAAVKPVADFLIVLLSITGIVADVRSSKSASLRVLFLFVYAGVILTYPVQDIRFLLPLAPLVLYYNLKAFQWARARLQGNAGKVVAIAGAGLAVIVAVPDLTCLYEVTRTNASYLSSPATMWQSQLPGTSSGNYFATPWAVLGRKILDRFEPGTVIASSDKEIVPFAPGMKFLELNRGVPLPMMESILRDHRVNYILAAASYGDVKTFQVTMNMSRRLRLEPVESVAGLTLYKLHSRLVEEESPEQVQSFTLDLNKVGDLMRLGQLALHAQRYSDALTMFTKARERFRQQSEITFHILMTHVLAGDSAQAVQEFQRLYASPSATSFIPPGRLALHAMSELKRVRSLEQSENRSDGYHRVASIFWSLGYGGEAYKLEKELLAQDPAHFVGLLWAWHWGIQRGDSVQTTGYLKTLRTIDSSNVIVRAFSTISRLHSAMRAARSGEAMGRIHVALAREYDSVDLPEEAFDAAERAIASNPSSDDAAEILKELQLKRAKK